MHPLLGSVNFGYVNRRLREERHDLDYQVWDDFDNPKWDNFNHGDYSYYAQRNYPDYSHCCSDQ